MTSFPKLSYVCPIPWTTMRGDERERFCSKCSRTVVNVSLLTVAQREALLANPPPGGLCVAYYQRLSGENVSAENPLTPFESKRIVEWGVAAASLTAAAALAVQLAPATAGSLVDNTQDLAALYDAAAVRGKEAVDAIGVELGLKTKTPPPAVCIILGKPALPAPTPPTPPPVPPKPAPPRPTPSPAPKPAPPRAV
jgi:outer membrane biosynthesis protein TonB